MKNVTIAVCTYRRASLGDTLASLMRIDLPPDVAAEIVVIDNDDHPSAKTGVEAFAATAPMPVRHVHAPAGNISIARNAALDATDARYLAFIDDDEEASETWLAALLDEMGKGRADAVLGPVRALYPETAPDWMRRENLHGAAPEAKGREITTGYSGNVLIDRACPAFHGLRFDPALGQTGGEDTIFFATAQKAGARIGYAPDALVTEAVPPARLAFRWLVARRLRTGRTHARRLLAIDGRNRWAATALAAAKIAYCLGQIVVALPSRRRRNLAALRLVFHGGVLLELTRPERRTATPMQEVRP